SARSPSVRDGKPMPSEPQAFPKAMSKRMIPERSSRLNATRWPPASSTATVKGAQLVSRPFLRAASTIVLACASVRPGIELLLAASVGDANTPRSIPRWLERHGNELAISASLKSGFDRLPKYLFQNGVAADQVAERHERNVVGIVHISGGFVAGCDP